MRASLASLQWTVNAYGIAFAAGIITAAALGDRHQLHGAAARYRLRVLRAAAHPRQTHVALTLEITVDS